MHAATISRASVGWVDLAPLADPTLIPGTIARVFGLSLDEQREPLDALVAALKKRSLLIVLDNCEHLTDSVAMIASALIAETQDVRLLATSRASLKIPDEQLYRLGPLTVPAAKASAQEAAEQGAVALFVARARAVDRHFEINENNVTAVVEVCAQLDGIPLAIELAAARLPVLGLPALITMLDQRFRLLSSGSRAAPARQQTMHATFDWSYGLLSELEKVVFRQLGIFAGGFTLEAVRRVVRSGTWDEWDVVDALGGLVEKSMVVVEGDESPRYHLLETGRAYALEKLSEAGETGDLERRHAALFPPVLRSGLRRAAYVNRRRMAGEDGPGAGQSARSVELVARPRQRRGDWNRARGRLTSRMGYTATLTFGPKVCVMFAQPSPT